MYQGGVKSTVSWVFENPKFKISRHLGTKLGETPNKTIETYAHTFLSFIISAVGSVYSLDNCHFMFDYLNLNIETRENILHIFRAQKTFSCC